MAQPIEIYQSADGTTQVTVRFEQGTVWLTQAQIAAVFEVKPQNITQHLKNIYAAGELAEAATCKVYLQVQQEGSRRVERSRKHYNLDAIISVGYRVNSARATQFRIWATQRLKDYLIQGYALNQQRFESNAGELRQALALIQKAAQSHELTAEAGSGLVEIVSRYTQTFLWLQQYDEGLLQEPKAQAGGDLPSADDAMTRLGQLKQQLIARGEATVCSPSRAEMGLRHCWATWIKPCLAGRPTPL